MDRFLTCEMAWISGHSLSQTVYTCTFFHHIKTSTKTPRPTLSSKAEEIMYGVLKTYVLATVKSCHYVWTEMTQGNVYEVNTWFGRLLYGNRLIFFCFFNEKFSFNCEFFLPNRESNGCDLFFYLLFIIYSFSLLFLLLFTTSPAELRQLLLSSISLEYM
jgi:hypothetical protein